MKSKNPWRVIQIRSFGNKSEKYTVVNDQRAPSINITKNASNVIRVLFALYPYLSIDSSQILSYLPKMNCPPVFEFAWTLLFFIFAQQLHTHLEPKLVNTEEYNAIFVALMNYIAYKCYQRGQKQDSRWKHWDQVHRMDEPASGPGLYIHVLSVLGSGSLPRFYYRRAKAKSVGLGSAWAYRPHLSGANPHSSFE